MHYNGRYAVLDSGWDNFVFNGHSVLCFLGKLFCYPDNVNGDSSDPEQQHQQYQHTFDGPKKSDFSSAADNDIPTFQMPDFKGQCHHAELSLHVLITVLRQK